MKAVLIGESRTPARLAAAQDSIVTLGKVCPTMLRLYYTTS